MHRICFIPMQNSTFPLLFIKQKAHPQLAPCRVVTWPQVGCGTEHVPQAAHYHPSGSQKGFAQTRAFFRSDSQWARRVPFSLSEVRPRKKKRLMPARNGLTGLHQSNLVCEVIRSMRESGGFKPIKCLTLHLAQGKASANAAVSDITLAPNCCH